MFGEGEGRMPCLEGLRRWRTARGMTLAELAQRTGMRVQDIERLERGAKIASRGEARWLADALGVEPADIVDPPPVPDARAASAEAYNERDAAEPPEWPNPNFIVQCDDPLGRSIRLMRPQWEGHIIAPGRHTELVSEERAVEQVLLHPEHITHDATYPHRENYYRRGDLRPPRDRLYLKVCVEFWGTGASEIVGEVVTAYPTGRLGKGEVPRQL